MEKDGHHKGQEAPQIAASCRSKLQRTLVFVYVRSLTEEHFFKVLIAYSTKQLFRKGHTGFILEHHIEGY